MEVYAKIGTGSQNIIRIKYKRIAPKVGDLIEFRTFPYRHRQPWRRGTVDLIKDLGYPLYYIALQ